MHTNVFIFIICNVKSHATFIFMHYTAQNMPNAKPNNVDVQSMTKAMYDAWGRKNSVNRVCIKKYDTYLNIFKDSVLRKNGHMPCGTYRMSKLKDNQVN